MTQNEVTITGMNTLAIPLVSQSGDDKTLAFFDCQANGIGMIGCSFMVTRRFGVTVYPPRVSAPGVSKRSVNFTDHALRSQVTSAAKAAFTALGGKIPELEAGEPTDHLSPAITSMCGNSATGGFDEQPA